MNKEDFDYLCLKGGGIKLFGHVGGLFGLTELNIYSQIKGVAGTSAGAIIGMLVSLGYSAEKISNLALTTDFNKFKDGFNPFAEIDKYGIFHGAVIQQWLEQQCLEVLRKSNATFKDLHDAGLKDLHVFAYDVDQNKTIEFCYQLTPNTPISWACACSATIPMIFDIRTMPSGEFANHRFWDGGLEANYPINTFPINKTIGFFLTDLTGEKTPETLVGAHPFKAAYHAISIAMNSQDKATLSNSEIMNQTVLIDTMGISAIDFNLAMSDKVKLITDNGKPAVLNFFK